MKKVTLLIATLVALTYVSGPTLAESERDTSSQTDSKIQHLLDRDEIRQAIVNYGLAFDMHNWPLHRSVFTDEIEMDFSASIGEGLTKMTADEWVAGVKPFFENLEGTQHIAMPLIIEIDGDSAYVRSMLNATHHLPNRYGQSLQTMVGYYDNWLVRTDSGWKINKMVQHITWNEGNWYVFEKAAGISQ